MVKRLVILCLMAFVVLSTTVSHADLKDELHPRLRAWMVTSVLSHDDYKSIARTLSSSRVSADPKNVAIELSGKTPDGNSLFTVALGTKGAAKDTAKAVLAFVEVPNDATPKVIAVGLVSIGEEDSEGHRTFEISGPGRKTVQVKYDPRSGRQVKPDREPTIGIQAVGACEVTCFVAEVVACTSVCTPLGVVTGGIGGWLCGTLCGAVFTWTCSYCP